MRNYLNQLNDAEWEALGSAYAQDAQAFFNDEKVFSREDQQKSLHFIKNRSLPKSGLTFQEVRREIVDYIIPGSIHQQSKNYLAFPDKGAVVSAQYATILNAALNQNVIADDKSAPTGTYVETTVIHWLRKLTGYLPSDAPYPESALNLGGAFVTGGVLANTTALLGARQRRFPETKTKGLASLHVQPKVIVAGATMSHYSHFGSSWWLGIGTDNVIEAPCGPDAKIDQGELERIIEGCASRGEPIIAIIAVMGDSRTNTLEDLPGLYAIAQRHDIWLHADACHGGILMFDQNFTHNGNHVLSYSDSLTFDPHKHFGIPYASSVVLFKDAKHLADVGSSTDITIAYDSSDIGQVTPFIGSKGLDALKLYAAIIELGLDGIVEQINTRKLLAREWAARINESRYFIALHDPELFAVSFSVRPDGLSAEEVSHRNLTLHNELYEAGDVVLHKFKIQDYRNRLGYGPEQSVIGLGSYIGVDTYTSENLVQLVSLLETAYEASFAPASHSI